MRHLALLYVLPIAAAFQVVPKTTTGHHAKRVVLKDVDEKGHHLAFNPMEGYQSVDVDRAKDCAEHFGKCSVEEMEGLRKNLHKERLIRFGVSTIDAPSGEAMEHLLLEEELELQLNLLKEQTPDPTLFPQVEEPMAELPHLKDQPVTAEMTEETDTDKNSVTKIAEDLFYKAEVKAVEQEAALDEESLEAAVICLVIAGLVFVPQLFHV